jgi:plastocyanin
MQFVRVRPYPAWLVMMAVLALAACGAATSNASSSAADTARTAGVSIPEGDRFLPFVTRVRHGATVTFHNGDSDVHTVTSVPGDPSAFNIRIEPGQTVTLTLRATGEYRYYCSIHATYDPATDQIAGKANADHPDEPMAGVLVVA